MKILLSGSTGFFGQIILKYLQNHDVFTINRFAGEYKVDLSKKVPEFSSCFDLVIHNAGKAHSFPRTETEENSFFQVNTLGTKNLLQGLETLIPKQFVFISSVSVYGLEYGVNVEDHAPLNAKDSYGLSKKQAEQIVIDWCNKNNVVCTILRLPLIVAKNPPGNLGVMLKGIEKGYYFNIGGGKAKRSMVLAQDVAKFIPRIAQIGGVYNLTDGYHPSFKELSHALANKPVFSLPLAIAKLFGKIGDLFGDTVPLNTRKILKMTSDLTFDDSKAIKIGWKPQSVLEYIKHNDLVN
jgi:nucleoside-diphosphate-sugar epimerase